MPMISTRTYGELSAFEKKRAQQIADHQAEVEQLKDRIGVLEGSNTALGKAIWLLRDVKVSEPETQPTRDPKHS